MFYLFVYIVAVSALGFFSVGWSRQYFAKCKIFRTPPVGNIFQPQKCVQLCMVTLPVLFDFHCYRRQIRTRDLCFISLMCYQLSSHIYILFNKIYWYQYFKFGVTRLIFINFERANFVNLFWFCKIWSY